MTFLFFRRHRGKYIHIQRGAWGDAPGVWRTKKGVTIAQDGLDTLINLLNEGKKKLLEAG